MSALSLRQLFQEYELNVHPNPAMNPPDAEGKVTNHKSFGVNVMRQMLEMGTFRVNENCVEFLREAKNYFVDQHGRFSDPDDCLDSARYGLLACLNGWTEPYDGKNPQVRMAEARVRMEHSRLNKQANKVDWKKTFNPLG